MNEAETRAELIDPALKASGWGVVEGSKILRAHRFTAGKILTGGTREKQLEADYILVYKHQKIAVIEAKQENLSATEGVGQAKEYAAKLHIDYTYATNGKEIYEISMKSGHECPIDKFPTPDELWNKTYSSYNEWREKFAKIPFEDIGGTKIVRYYQEIAINKALDAIALGKQRLLLTLATGTGKTFIAFQIAWKLFHARWNLQRDGRRQPRILFLADRNILADQAFNAFSAFPEDALVRISPADIRKKGNVPTTGSIFFTIFQTFMSGPNNSPYFGDYPKDFFDFIVIDECHRGGANDESNWRDIMEHFSSAVQLGLTATPKREENINTYRYFGDPLYVYSLKEGVNDGFLTPFKIKRISTTLDEYIYTPDDKIIEGEVEEGKVYEEADFNRIIEIKERESVRVKLLLQGINQKEKTIVFCANQAHALVIRDLINQLKTESSDPNYCVRVTANEGARGDQFLRDFQDNDKTIPTILTTSQKLSTGVDARNIRNIVIMRPINSIVEFKQIIGRGTRLFDGKEYFTIIDFVGAYKLFLDPEWDGDPVSEEKCAICGKSPCECAIKPPRICPVCGKRPCVCIKEPPPVCTVCGKRPCQCKKKVKIKLADGKEREIQSMTATFFMSADGRPISAEEYLRNMFGALPEFFKSEKALRKLWADPKTRKVFLDKISTLGYGKEQLETMQKMINAEDSDLFDVLAYVAFAIKPISRQQRASETRQVILKGVDDKQKEFLEFVINKYVEIGYEELGEDKLPVLLDLKYHTTADAVNILGGVEMIRAVFFNFQKKLYGVA